MTRRGRSDIRGAAAAGVFAAPPSVSFSHITSAAATGTWEGLALLLSVFFSLNLVLLALNILTLPPLDGSAAVPLLLSPEASSRYQQFLWRQPGLTWIGMLVAWRIFDVIFDPVFLAAVNLLYPGVRYG